MREADLLLGGRLRLHQATSGHRAGTDAILLAAAAPPTDGTILDAGAGTGAAGLALGQRCPAASLTLVEIDPDQAALCRDNLALNGMAARGRVVACDLTSAKARRAADLADGKAEVLLTNPPWLEPGKARLSPDDDRARAHAQAPGVDLADWIRACTALTAPGGTLVLVHRADRLGDILAALGGRFGHVAIRPVHPRAEAPAHRLLVTARKGSRAPLTLLPGLVLHDSGGRFTPQAEALHRGETCLAAGQ